MTSPRQGALEWDEETLAEAMRLSVREVADCFKDGRRVSFLLERRIVVRGTLAPSEGAAHDLRDSAGGLWEVRSISKGGVCLLLPEQHGRIEQVL